MSLFSARHGGEVAVSEAAKDQVSALNPEEGAGHKLIEYEAANTEGLLKYDGVVKSGSIRHGKGKLTYRNGRCYDGEFVDGKRAGNGKMTWSTILKEERNGKISEEYKMMAPAVRDEEIIDLFRLLLLYTARIVIRWPMTGIPGIPDETAVAVLPVLRF